MENFGITSRVLSEPPSPRLSVIVPVRDGEQFLADSLPALRASDLPSSEWELLVVDDASSDSSADLARRYADDVVRLSAPHGAAFARNRAAEQARGAILAFIDADVSVHQDTLRRLVETLDREVGVAAVFGAYDTVPPAPGLVSQYRNLLHHYVHAQQPGEAETFWSGCGAMRRACFTDAGGFDERISQMEDIELGYRVRAIGHRILLRPEIQATHLKRWTIRSMVQTDLFGRGVTWMRLHLEQRHRGRPSTLNIRPAEKLYTLLTGFAGCALLLAGGLREPLWLVPAIAALVVVLAGNAPLFRWFAGVRGWWFALRIIPLRLLYYALNSVAAPIGWLWHTLMPRVSGAAPSPTQQTRSRP
jgi:glycosyltransferase involved in cell wall biosynthesis